MERYNLDKLIKVVVNDAYQSRRYEFKKEKSFLGRITTKEGFYYWLDGSYLGMEAPKNHFIKEGKMYEKPEVVLCFENDYQKTYYFDSLELAETFARDLTNARNWIK
ncbi:MAG: hypothetical protein ACYC5G_01235 [Candidatus Doudnabacteria bacterium]